MTVRMLIPLANDGVDLALAGPGEGRIGELRQVDVAVEADLDVRRRPRQRLAWADNAIKLAVDLTVAAINRANIQGTTDQQAEQLRTVMATIFPEAVTLVREAREGLQ